MTYGSLNLGKGSRNLSGYSGCRGKQHKRAQNIRQMHRVHKSTQYGINIPYSCIQIQASLELLHSWIKKCPHFLLPNGIMLEVTALITSHEMRAQLFISSPSSSLAEKQRFTYFSISIYKYDKHGRKATNQRLLTKKKTNAKKRT